MQVHQENRCSVCKGHKHLCGRSECPILQRVRIRSSILPRLSQDIFGSSPSSIFVGSWNYPKVFVGPLVPPVIGDTSEMDHPEIWFGRSLTDIIEFRSSMVRSKDAHDVNAVRDPTRSIMLMQEIVMSDKPVDTELSLEKKPRFSLKFNEFSPPYGPSEVMRKLDVTQNPHIPRVVDSVHNDELAATDGIRRLYDKDIEVSHISKMLSAGILGDPKRRKFVPTRWSITATDDIISKQMLDDIRTYPQLSDIQVFHAHDVGNTLAAVLVPGIWSYEFLECWLPGALFSGGSTMPQIISDWEYYQGRKTYAKIIAGAYYAGRLPVAEYLEQVGRQATCFVIMEVDPSYHTPIGVWRIRTILREAFASRPVTCETTQEAFGYLSSVLHLPGTDYMDASQLLHFTERQKVLDEWL
jgi:hypothetical protein